MVSEKVLVLDNELGVWTVRLKRGGELIVEEYRATRGTRIDIPAAEANAIIAASEASVSEPSLMGKAVLWAMAEVSQLVNGKLDDANYQGRIDACKSCDALDAREAPLVGYCKACGCGQNPRSELTVKGRMPGATCPKNKWAPLTIATEASQ